VEGLDGLRRLRELVLDRNRIKSLSENSFSEQGVLLDLHLAENRIRELNHLHPLKGLQRLFLDMNKIQVHNKHLHKIHNKHVHKIHLLKMHNKHLHKVTAVTVMLHKLPFVYNLTICKNLPC